MILPQFTTNLDPALIEKGKSWFSQGMVQNVKNDKDYVWDAEVIGPTKQFKVSIRIEGNEVIGTFCTCSPKLCSHIVAVLFELVEKKYPTNKAMPKTVIPVRRSAVAEALDDVSSDDLRAFVENYAGKDKDFRALLLIHFGDDDRENQVDHFRSMVRRSFKGDYNERTILNGARNVLQEAETNIQQGNLHIAFAACQAVLIELEPLLNVKYAGNVMVSAIEWMMSIVSHDKVPKDLQIAVFKYARQLSKTPAYPSYGLNYTLDKLLILQPNR